MNCFLTGRGRMTDDEIAVRERVAAKHGCGFVNTCLPGDGWRSWFEGENRGWPFDRDLERDVRKDLAREIGGGRWYE